MDNLPANKLASIKAIIESLGAKFLSLYPYFPETHPIKLWWSQL